MVFTDFHCRVARYCQSKINIRSVLWSGLRLKSFLIGNVILKVGHIRITTNRQLHHVCLRDSSDVLSCYRLDGWLGMHIINVYSLLNIFRNILYSFASLSAEVIMLIHLPLNYDPFLGRLPKVDLIILEGENVRTSTKSFFDFNEIWYIGRGR